MCYAEKVDLLVETISKFRDDHVAFAKWHSDNYADAEEAVANAYVKAFVNIDRWTPSRGSIHSWLLKIIYHECMNIHRKRLPQCSNSAEMLNSLAKDDSPERLLQNAETAEAVQNALASLTDEERECILLKEYHELSVREIEHATTWSIAKVARLLASARGKLKESLADLYPLAGANKANQADQQIAIVEQACSADAMPVTQDRFPYLFAATHSFQDLEFRIVAGVNGDGKKRLIAMQQATQDVGSDWKALAATAQACCQGTPQLIVIDPDESIFENFSALFTSTNEDGAFANFQFCTATPTFPQWTTRHPDCLVSFQRFAEQHHELLKSTNLIRNAFRNLQVPASQGPRARLIESAVRSLLFQQRKITGCEILPD